MNKGLLKENPVIAAMLGANTPSYARVYNRMGTQLLKANKPAEAAEQFRKALEEDSSLAGAYNNLGTS